MEHWIICNKEELLSPPKDGPAILTTVNADIYRTLKKQPELRDILLKEKICLDGRPLYYISRLIEPEIQLVQGSSLIYDIARQCAKSGAAILIFGGSEAANAQAVERLKLHYGCRTFGLSPARIDEQSLLQAVRIIHQHSVGYVFVCLGAPKQERVAIELHNRLEPTSQVLLIGAGGTVDFAANRISRAPALVQKMGLEGIYRLVQEPSMKRVKRLLTSMAGLSLFVWDLMLKRIRIQPWCSTPATGPSTTDKRR